MVSMLRPALFIMNRLKFPQKFFLISFLFALPLGLTTFYFVHGINADISLASKERKGITYIHALNPLVEHLQVLRGTAFAEGISKSFYVQRAQSTSQLIAADIQAIDTTNNNLGKKLKTESLWQNWKSSWMQFQHEAPSLTHQKYFDRCSDLIAGAGTLMSQVGENSDLVLDSSIDSTNLIKISLDNLPLIADLFGQMCGQHRAQPQKDLSFSEEQRLALLTQAQGEWEEVEHGLNEAYKVNLSLKADMEPQTRILRNAFQDLSALSMKRSTQVTSSAVLLQENRRLFSTYTGALRATFAERDLISHTLNALLTQRVQEFKTERNQVLGLTFVTALLVLYFLTGFYASIHRMVDRLTTTTNQMLAGEKAEIVILENRDEMAQVVASFNKIILELQKTAAEVQHHNESGRQLQREDVVDRVEAIQEKTGMEATLLKLEITESVMMNDVEATIAKLHRLKALGVKLAMDDFGTGYSSMANLSLFPLDTVKIDRSFVQHLSDQEQAVSVVAAIINLSHALNMDVTGEGIETPDHVSYLQSMGCQIGQGYYFDRPMPASNMGEKINTSDSAHIQSRDASDIELIEKLLRAA